MTPEDLTLLKRCYSRINHRRSDYRLDASMGFKTLNRKYGRAVVDAKVQEIKKEKVTA